MRRQKEFHIFFLALVIFLFSIAVRIPFKSEMFASWDGPQFAIAMKHYSIQDYFPGFPGHFLYIMAAKFINIFLRDPFSSLLYLSIVFSGLICVTLFLVGIRIFNFRVGLISAFLYLASPLFWFYSTTINPFPMEGFFALLAGFFLFETIYRRHENSLLWASLFYGVMIGVRPQDFIFLFPLWAWAFFAVRLRAKILSSITLFFVCLMWFIPMSIVSGGIRELSSFVLKEASSGSSRLSSSIFNVPGLLKANVKYQIFVYIVTFGLGVIVFFYYLPQFFNIKSIFSDRRKQIFLVWIIPSLIFWSIFNFATPGYILVSLLLMIILLAEFLSKITDELAENISLKLRYFKNRNVILISFMSILIVTNTIGYFYDFNSLNKGNYTDSFRRFPDNKKIDIQSSGKFRYIRENIPAENSIIIASATLFMQTMYYLPRYHVYLFKGITHKNSTSVIYGHDFKRRNLNDREALKLISDDRIERIVFVDDDFEKWINSQAPKETISIAEHYRLTVVFPKRNERLRYGYQDIQIK